MPEREDAGSAAGRRFLHVHPLVWIVAGIIVLLLAARTLGDGMFTWLAPLGLFGFWVVITVLMVLFVTLLVLTKRAPQVERSRR